MPIHTKKITLGATPVEVVGPDVMGQKVYLHNMEKSSNQYIHIGGDSSITVNNSIHIDPGESIDLQLGPSDALYALSDPAGLDLGVLVVKQD